MPGSAEDFGGFEKKSVELSLAVRRRRVTFASSRRPCDGSAHVLGGGGADGKSQNRKNVYLSPYFEEPLNSKVIKSFVPELRSRKWFSCFGIPMFYAYMLWTFNVRFTYSCMAMLHFHMINSSPWLRSRIMKSFSVDEALLLRCVNLFTNFKEPPFRVKMCPSWLKHMYSVLSAFTWRPMPPAACVRLCSKDSALVGVVARIATVICEVCVRNNLCEVISIKKWMIVFRFVIIPKLEITDSSSLHQRMKKTAHYQ